MAHGSHREGIRARVTTFLHPKGKTFRYDFHWTNPQTGISKRYTGSTGQLTKDAADQVEDKIKENVRKEAYGILPFDRTRTPSFQAWASTHLKYVAQRGKVRRIDFAKATLRLCLQFWGRRPTKLPDPDSTPTKWRAQIAAARSRIESAPFHDLRLADPILDPEWILRFEEWLDAMQLSGPRKNHYRSAMSTMYRTALLPQFRKKTNVSLNPFANIERDTVPSRDTTLTIDQIRALITHAAPHLRVALAIAAYAPELREGSILGLKWRVHLSPTLARITVVQHKTKQHTQRPQIVPISDDLRAILEWARKRTPGATYVITFKRKPVKRIGTALRTAVTRANATLPKDERMTYGVRNGGLSFHTIRHSVATLLAEAGESEAIRQLLMGHSTAAMTQKYTHLAARAKEAPLERLASALQLVDAVQGPLQTRTTQTPRNTKYFKRHLTRG